MIEGRDSAGPSGVNPPPQTIWVKRKESLPGSTHLPGRNALEISYSDVHYWVRDEGKGMKEILKGLDGRMKSGELTAVMGPSGSGKSSLMNILAGYRQKDVTGKIEVNGRERNLRVFRHQSSYIPQEDQVVPTLTVMESMLFAAGLKLSSSLSFRDKYTAVVAILQHLGMQDCARTRASCLSGGERKRLCIALELLADPQILFLDEPTRRILHETDEMFDHLILLADGRCLYHGTISSLVPYFRQFGLHCPPYHNPADFGMHLFFDVLRLAKSNLIEVAAGFYGREAMTVLSDAAKAEVALPVGQEDPDPHTPSNSDRKSSNASHEKWGKVKDMLETRKEVVDDDTADYSVSFKTQVQYLYLRCLKTTSRDLWLLYVRVAAHVMVGLFMGIFFFGKGDDASSVYHNVSSLFFTILFVVFAAMMPTVVTYPLEVPVLLKEILNKWYSLKAYYVAKTMADVPFSVFCTLVYLVIVYYMTAQPMDFHRFFRYLVISVFVSVLAQSLGLLIGTLFPIQAAVFVGPAFIAPFLLFSGFFLSVKAIPKYMRWVSNLSFLKYYFEGTMVCIYGYNRSDLLCNQPFWTMVCIYGYNRSDLLCNQPFCQFKDPDKFLRELDLEENVYWIDFWVLVLYNVVLRFVSYFVLRWKLHHSL
ncbi:unnamed protein product [Darwinula stevensoni]|uniref:ABC transporter domain-containing protein n=1 Tax=Darwinula stevensoni TaxID=69355 RepID=A0A7R9AA13_9CRUS|nr:unnamed protein product [Darwinula stevensoni]CAG0897822.1 unnamed protein product [Darwinula stevensoni]